MLRTLGSQPRFSPNGFELVYTHTDLLGAVDLWKVDLRDGSTSAVTDAAEIDFEPDWSPDGRTIAFASNQGGGPMTLWIIPAVGGKRRPLETPGFFPRFSADGRSLLFWNRSALWSSSIDGGGPKAIREAVAGPRPGVMRNKAATISTDSEIQGDRVLWPEFDVLPDGRTLTAPIEIHETALWSVQPTYVD
jgi:dipeptidyl aminopeptidase/acylaminoacyl peptidase